MAARHRTLIPASVQAAGRLPESDVQTHKETESTGLHNDALESGTGKGTTTGSRGRPRKRCVIIAVDSTGIKVANRGEWIRDKWQKKKRGYIKIHVAVNTKTKQIIISMIVTKEKVSDGRMLKPLVKQVPYVMWTRQSQMEHIRYKRQLSVPRQHRGGACHQGEK